MAIFSNKPTTVAGVFEAAVADVKAISVKQLAASAKLTEEQASRKEVFEAKRLELEVKFKDESTINTDKKSAADLEVAQAEKVVSKFAELFGIDEA